MTVRRAVAAEAPVVAAMLTAFNAEFDTWAPPLADLERRFASLLDQPAMMVLLAEPVR